MKKFFTKYFDYLIIIVSIIFVFIVSINSLSSGAYPTVAEKWFKYGKITPPLDNNPKDYREIEIDLYAPLEIDQDGNKFYWVQNNGDTITLTNFNWFDIEGTLSFDLERDPCKNTRNILIGLESGSQYISTTNSLNPYAFKVELKSNSSVFINLIPEPGVNCYLNSDDKRNFAFKIVNPIFKIINAIK